MLLLFGVLLTLAIPLLALRGRGARQLYIHAAIVALPFGAALLWLGQMTPPVDTEKMSAAQVDGVIGAATFRLSDAEAAEIEAFADTLAAA